jgi:hypothetical protein
MSMHRTLMARGRAVQQRTAGRLTTYVPPTSAGTGRTEGVVRYLSAEDDIFETDRGDERLRAITVNASIGSAEGQFAQVDIGGSFLLDVDGSGTPDPWTIKQFPNADAGATDGMGFKRCLCVRPLLQKGTFGQRPKDR